MEKDKEDCKYFCWTVVSNSCCGRPAKDKKHGTCTTEQGTGRMCNTTMHYCAYEKKEDENNSEL